MPDFFVPDERDLRFASTGSNFGTLVKLQRYPRNIPYIPACPVGLADRTGVVAPPEAYRLPPLKVRDLRLELKHKLPFFKGLTVTKGGIKAGMDKTFPEGKMFCGMIIAF